MKLAAAGFCRGVFTSARRRLVLSCTGNRHKMESRPTAAGRAAAAAAASPEGTASFAQAFVDKGLCVPEHYRTVALGTGGGGMTTLSSLGIGTYLGDQSAETSAALVEAVVQSVALGGWNVIDTASNYRHGQSEVDIGEALRRLLLSPQSSAGVGSGAAAAAAAPAAAARSSSAAPEPAGEAPLAGGQIMSMAPDMIRITRDMLFVCSKAGYLSGSGALAEALLAGGAIGQQDIVGGHCMHPDYIKASCDQSLLRMGLASLDVLYLHNAAEAQLASLGRSAFMRRLAAAFAACDELRREGKIRHYGLATWSCFREPPATHPVRTSSAAADSSTYLSLEEVLSLACQAGGTEGHGFKFIQLPISVGMPEAWSKGDWQPLGGRRVSLLQCAAELGIRVVGSGPLMEAGLISAAVDSALDGVPAVAQVAGVAPRLLQLARGAPGVTCTLVGHKQPAHVSANTALSRVAPLTAGQFEDAMANIAQGIRRM